MRSVPSNPYLPADQPQCVFEVGKTLLGRKVGAEALAVRTTDAGEICSHGTRELRHWDRARDDCIMGEYGLPPGPHPDWEIDHLVPLGIGGADDVRNLWPEPRRSIEPQWNAETKDRLEWKLRDLICSGQLDVAAAQRSIADDWTEAYGRFFPESRVNAFSPAAGAMTPK